MALYNNPEPVLVSDAVEVDSVISGDDLFVTSIDDNSPSYDPLPSGVQAALDAVLMCELIKSMRWQQIQMVLYHFKRSVEKHLKR